MKNKKIVIEETLSISIRKLKEYDLIGTDKSISINIKTDNNLFNLKNIFKNIPASWQMHIVSFSGFYSRIKVQVCQGEICICSQKISIERAPCNFGGYRNWFECSCGRKVMKLYFNN